MSNWFVLRADANEKIGIGHVMRCLALAELLSLNNIRTVLLTKYANEFIESKIDILKGKIIYLPKLPYPSERTYPHSRWLNGSESDDAKLCIDAIEEEKNNFGESPPLFILVDHYALGAPWEQKLTHFAPILALDDLSDRQHNCKWLLDQTFGKKKADYFNLVPSNTKLLIGPQYALIRNEFAKAAQSLQRMPPDTKVRVLVTLGGVDKNNDTDKVLSFLEASEKHLKKKIVITVVTSNSNPNLHKLKITINKMTDTSLLINVNNMARLMATNDVCIGAAGSTSWERCVMSLPTISVVLAENQLTIANNLAKAGAILDLGLMKDITHLKFFGMFKSLINDIELYNSLCEKSKLICDGLGCNRIMKEVIDNNA